MSVARFNVLAGFHDGVYSAITCARTLAKNIDGLTLAMLVKPSKGKYELAGPGDERLAEFVWELKNRQSSGTITTIWNDGEFETNVYEGTPEPDDYLAISDGGKLVVTTDETKARWFVLSVNGDMIRFKTI